MNDRNSDEKAARPQMANTSGPDDLSALLQQIGMNEQAYKQFDTPARAQTDAVPSKTQRTNEPTRAPSIPSVRRLHGQLRVRDKETREFASLASEQVPEDETSKRNVEVLDSDKVKAERVDRATPTDAVSLPVTPLIAPSSTDLLQKRPRQEKSWSRLERILGREHVDEEHPVISATKSLSVPVVFVTSDVGGVGCTTLAVHLSRALGLGGGESVLLLDTEEHSLLTHFFALDECESGKPRRVPANEERTHLTLLSLPTLDRRAWAWPNHAREIAPEQTGVLRRAALSVQRVLIDDPSLTPSDRLSAVSFGQHCLVPIVPDLNCALMVTRMEERLAESPREFPGFYYVLNKFDSSLPLHRDLKAYLREKVKDRLLRVSVRRSDVIPEALAEGMTVLDYAPETGVAEDFIQLAMCVRELSPSSSGDEQ